MKLRATLLAACVAVLVGPAVVGALTIDVCGHPALDFRADGQGFVFVGLVVPGGTIPDGGVPGHACETLESMKIGRLFAQGNVVSGMRFADPDDASFEDFHLRIDNQGSVATTGPVKSGPYSHVILGGTGVFLGMNGEARMQPLDGVGFQFRMKLPRNTASPAASRSRRSTP